jgi:serine/threonine protein kinase
VDFGIAGLVNHFNMDKIDMGSLKYMAPETLSGKNVKIGPSIDIWALGCVLYALLTGDLPFHGQTS